MLSSRYFVSTLLLLFVAIPCRAQTVLHVQPIDSEHHRYCSTLLKLALTKAGENVEIKEGDIVPSQARAIQNLRDGKLDVLWLATSKELEQEYLPIRVPLYRGMLGFRIFIIRKGDQSRFDGIDSLEELKKINLGQGSDWSDTPVLKENGFKVTTNGKYNGLFDMLDGGRFDAFPRGVHEPWGEIKSRPELSLTTENNLALVYKMPMYFYVTKDNSELAQKIELGLMAMLKDGDFDNFFFNDPMIKDTLERSNLANRTFFEIENPFLSAETPIDNKLLWLNINDLK